MPIIIGIISMLIFGLSLNCEKTIAESEVIYSAENNVALKSTRIVSDGTIQHYSYDETNFM